MGTRGHGRWLLPALAALALLGVAPHSGRPGCGSFAAKDQEFVQLGQQVFLTWDPEKGMETFTVQPRFEGNAPDFGMVVPTPSRPRVDAMPRDFFRHLAVFSALKEREFPASKLLPPITWHVTLAEFAGTLAEQSQALRAKAPPVVVLESGLVGSLDYKILNVERADELSRWLKENHYPYPGDEATLKHYVQKKWVFTVLKIDTTALRRSKDGSFSGEVIPIRFQFKTSKPVYPLRIAQFGSRDRTDLLFYVQAPFKADLPGDLTYQHQWIPMLQAAVGHTPGGFPANGAQWLQAAAPEIPNLLKRAADLGFTFTPGRRPTPNKQGRTPTTLEWARRLTDADLKLLRGQAPYTEKLPDVDDGFAQADLKNAKRAEAIFKVIRQRLLRAHLDRPNGYSVRQASADDLRGLRQLEAHLRAGQFLTKFRKVFTRDELGDDLEIVPARLGRAEDVSEYEERLPTAPP